MLKFQFRDLTLVLVLSLFGCGAVATIAGFLGWFYPVLSIILAIPATLLAMHCLQLVRNFSSLGKHEKLLLIALQTLWLIHGVNVLVPETGFDAVWYHLPVVAAMADAHRFVYLPDLYQSVNPLFSDLLFLLGFLLKGEVGTKMVAYLVATSLILVTYQLSSRWLPRTWSLILVLLVSTFQVITWQASSFYVDVAKALWEISCLWCLIRWYDQERFFKRTSQWWLVLSALLFGASVATKAFSFLLLPVMQILILLLGRSNKVISVITFITLSLLVAFPFYFRTYQALGTPFASSVIHLQKLDEIGGTSSIAEYVLQRLISLPLSPIELFFKARDYISVGLVVLLPFIFLNRPLFKREKLLITLLLFSLSQYVLWWFLPPVSTRYALSGFVTMALVTWVAVHHWCQKHPEYAKPLWIVMILAIVINTVPRLVVLNRSLTYLSEGQSKTKYLHQFYDGGIDRHLQKWHHLDE